MPAIIIPDLHIGLNWDGCDRTPDVFEFLKNVNQHVKGRDVIFLGDIFDNIHISHKHIAQFMNILHQYKESGCGEIYILHGNHDGMRSLKHGSPLQEVEASGICNVIWSPVIIGKYAFFPHTMEPIAEMPLTKDMVAFCHLDIEGVIPGIEKEIGQGVDTFLPKWVSDKVHHVFAGHIHHVQKQGNIDIVGAAVRVNTKEANELSRIILLEDALSFISIPLPSRNVTTMKVFYGSPDSDAQLAALSNMSVKDHIVSVAVVCPHTEAHKFDHIKFEEDLRKRCHYLRFTFDVVKEKELRIKELDDSKSDIEITKLFLEKQNISDALEILNCCNEVMQ